MGRIQYEPARRRRRRRGNLLRGSGARSRPRAGDGRAHQAVLGSRRLAQGRADDGARRELHAVAIDKARLLFEAANIYDVQAAPGRSGASSCTRAVIALDPEHVEAGRAAGRALLPRPAVAELSPVIDMLCRKVGQLHADPKELNELYYRAAKYRRRARRLPQGAQLLQGGLRPRLDVPADARRPRRLAVQDAGLGRRRQDLPDHPGPAPRRPGRGRDRPHLLPARQRSPGMASARRRSTCSRRRSRSIRPSADVAGGHRSAARSRATGKRSSTPSAA